MTRADLGLDAELLVWPDNWQAWTIFRQMATQWRAGMAGPTGLDYGALFPRMERLRLDDEAWESLFSDIQVMEAAALEQMAEDREEATRR